MTWSPQSPGDQTQSWPGLVWSGRVRGHGVFIPPPASASLPQTKQAGELIRSRCAGPGSVQRGQAALSPPPPLLPSKPSGQFRPLLTSALQPPEQAQVQDGRCGEEPGRLFAQREFTPHDQCLQISVLIACACPHATRDESTSACTLVNPCM